MGEGIGFVLVLLCLFQAKHVFADYFLQTRLMLDARDVYLHLGRFLHAGVHALGSVIVFLVIGAPLAFILIVVLAEWVLHFHIDWWKGRYTANRKLSPDDAVYWRATGVDQALHQFTYLAMVGAWAFYSAG